MNRLRRGDNKLVIYGLILRNLDFTLCMRCCLFQKPFVCRKLENSMTQFKGFLRVQIRVMPVTTVVVTRDEDLRVPPAQAVMRKSVIFPNWLPASECDRG